MECTYTNLDGAACYTPRLYGTSLTGPPSYVRSVTDRNVVRWRVTVCVHPSDEQTVRTPSQLLPGSKVDPPQWCHWSMPIVLSLVPRRSSLFSWQWACDGGSTGRPCQDSGCTGKSRDALVSLSERLTPAGKPAESRQCLCRSPEGFPLFIKPCSIPFSQKLPPMVFLFLRGKHAYRSDSLRGSNSGSLEHHFQVIWPGLTLLLFLLSASKHLILTKKPFELKLEATKDPQDPGENHILPLRRLCAEEGHEAGAGSGDQGSNPWTLPEFVPTCEMGTKAPVGQGTSAESKQLRRALTQDTRSLPFLKQITWLRHIITYRVWFTHFKCPTQWFF